MPTSPFAGCSLLHIYQNIAADTTESREVRARALLAGGEEKLGTSPPLPVISHSIDFPSNLAILNRIVAAGSFSPRLRAERWPLGRCRSPRRASTRTSRRTSRHSARCGPEAVAAGWVRGKAGSLVPRHPCQQRLDRIPQQPGNPERDRGAWFLEPAFDARFANLICEQCQEGTR